MGVCGPFVLEIRDATGNEVLGDITPNRGFWRIQFPQTTVGKYDKILLTYVVPFLAAWPMPGIYHKGSHHGADPQNEKLPPKEDKSTKDKVYEKPTSVLSFKDSGLSE